MTEDQLAKHFEDEVRGLLGRALERTRPGAGDVVSRHPEAVRSSWSPAGRRTGWIEPSPFKVLVFTEYGIGDPFAYSETKRAFERVVEALKRRPEIEDAGWESYSAAVAYF